MPVSVLGRVRACVCVSRRAIAVTATIEVSIVFIVEGLSRERMNHGECNGVKIGDEKV